MADLLRFDDVTCGYGAAEVLRGVTFAVGEGQVSLLVGVNGSGKSTLVRACIGLADVMRGEILVGGAALPRTGAPASFIALGIHCLPQARSVFPDLTVRENLSFRASLFNPGGASEAVSAAVEVFPFIARQLDSPAGTLSGGEQRMVGLMSAIAARPRVLLLDEPSIGVAPTTARALFRFVKSWACHEGVAVLIAEQRLREVADVVDAVYVAGECTVRPLPTFRASAGAETLMRQVAGVWTGNGKRYP